jgi:hypothetical protein
MKRSMLNRLNALLIALAVLLTGSAGMLYLSARAQQKPPQTGGDPNAEDAWAVIEQVLGTKGTMDRGLYRVTLEREDLDVQMEAGAVPAGALRSEFDFFRCDCGKMNVVGQFCVADYEANDVMDALRQGAGMKVASVAPMFMGDHPRVLAIRFQGEGGARQLASLIHEALGWMGEARMAPATRPTTQP